MRPFAAPSLWIEYYKTKTVPSPRRRSHDHPLADSYRNRTGKDQCSQLPGSLRPRTRTPLPVRGLLRHRHIPDNLSLHLLGWNCNCSIFISAKALTSPFSSSNCLQKTYRVWLCLNKYLIVLEWNNETATAHRKVKGNAAEETQEKVTVGTDHGYGNGPTDGWVQFKESVEEVPSKVM